jgi:hypothetical protein
MKSGVKLGNLHFFWDRLEALKQEPVMQDEKIKATINRAWGEEK